MHAYASRGRGRPPGVRPDRTLNYNTITLLSVGVHICAGWLNIEKSFLSRFVVSFYIAKGPCRSCGKFYWSTLWFMKITGGKRKKEKKKKLFIAPTYYRCKDYNFQRVSFANIAREWTIWTLRWIMKYVRLKIENFVK